MPDNICNEAAGLSYIKEGTVSDAVTFGDLGYGGEDIATDELEAYCKTNNVNDDWADDGTASAGAWQEADKAYYNRGFGLMGLKGASEYSEFSKAVFGDEWTLSENPDMVYDFPPGSAGDFQIMPVAILIWRYLQNYHAGLPSGHDVVTGFWEPTDAEEEAGLKGPRDFCTLFTQLAAGVAMRNSGAEVWASETAYSSFEFIRDGSMADAAF